MAEIELMPDGHVAVLNFPTPDGQNLDSWLAVAQIGAKRMFAPENSFDWGITLTLY
jgi:hypothetical protein